MKYFLCSFDERVYLGVPSERTERVVSVSRTQASACETEKENVFISLPVLFGRGALAAPHGIVLKAASQNEKKRMTLLAPPLDIDREIPEEDIYTVPKAFGEMLRYCRGACFVGGDRDERLVFILDIEKLTKDFS